MQLFFLEEKLQEKWYSFVISVNIFIRLGPREAFVKQVHVYDQTLGDRM
jgi:hypothetical protein